MSPPVWAVYRDTAVGGVAHTAAPVEARPLAADDPYALDRSASRAVSALPNG